MQKGKFLVYSKAACGFCSRLTEFMDNKAVDYEKYELGEDFSIEDFVRKFGHNSSFPQVVYHNEHIGGMKNTVRYLPDHRIV